MGKTDDRDEDDGARRRRADRVRRRITDLTKTPGNHPERQPGESDAEYVERRMREIERKGVKRST